MLVHDRRENKTVVIDFRETAPEAAQSERSVDYARVLLHLLIYDYYVQYIAATNYHELVCKKYSSCFVQLIFCERKNRDSTLYS